MNGERAAEKLAVDANILISAVISGRARQIMLRLRKKTAFVTTAKKMDEVRKGLAHIAKKRDLDLELLLAALDALPIEIIRKAAYASKLDAAYKVIGKRDPSDVDLLALAMARNIPLWSEDRDFEDCPIELYTTRKTSENTVGISLFRDFL